MIHVVMPTYNRIRYCISSIESLYCQSYSDFTLILVDDNSPDNTAKIIKSKFPQAMVLNGSGDLWWTGATNMGCKYALKHGATTILTLNDDIMLNNNYLKQMVWAHNEYPNALIGSLCVSYEQMPKLLYAGDISHSHWTAKTVKRGQLNALYKFDLTGMLPTCSLPGRGTLIPRKIFEAIGLFDERSFPHYAADNDFSIRAKAKGYSLLINSQAVVYSHYKATGLGGSAILHDTNTFIKSFFSFKSSNYLPIMLRFGYKHHPIKIYYPFYFTLLLSRVVGGYIKRRVAASLSKQKKRI